MGARADEVFRYGSVAVHPHVIRSTLASEEAVREYQVRQTEGGTVVAYVTSGHLTTAALAARLQHALHQAGLTQPHVGITLADTIARDPNTGKVSRFITMGGHLAQPGDTGF